MKTQGFENTTGLCAECGEPLPDGSRKDRMYHPGCGNKAWARINRPSKKSQHNGGGES